MFKLCKILTSLSAFTIVALVAGCSNHPAGQPVGLAQLGFVKVDHFKQAHGDINPIRLSELHETATTLGARGALAWRSHQINQSLTRSARYLDQVFNFNQLLLNHNVLPPIVTQSQANLTLDNDDTIRSADKTYKITQPARFVTVPPTWRTYLWMNFKKPNLPSTTLLPTNREEAEVWNIYLKMGWQKGLEQANQIFEANLSILKRNYLGMILYRRLLAQGVITHPVVAKANLGITGNAKEIRINDEVMRITAHSALQPHGHWKPVLTKGKLSP